MDTPFCVAVLRAMTVMSFFFHMPWFWLWPLPRSRFIVAPVRLSVYWCPIVTLFHVKSYDLFMYLCLWFPRALFSSWFWPYFVILSTVTDRPLSVMSETTDDCTYGEWEHTEHSHVTLRNREWDGCNVWDVMLRVVCSQRARENRKMSAVWFCPLMPVVMVVMQVRRGCLRSANKYSRIRTEQREGSESQCQYTAVLNSHPCTHAHSHTHSYTVPTAKHTSGVLRLYAVH